MTAGTGACQIDGMTRVERALGLPGDVRRRRGIETRTIAVVVAAAVLMATARNHIPTPVLASVAVLYVATATLWVRGQYDASVAGRLWTPPLRLSGGVAAVALVALVGGWLASVGVLVIGGLVALFFALGYLAMGLRTPAEGETRPDRDPRRWAWFAGTLAALALLGLLLVGLHVATLALTAIALVLIPVPVSVLTSHLHGALVDGGIGWSRWRQRAVPAGLVLLLGGALLAWPVRVQNPWMLLAVAVIALLAIALASSTYADIAVIIGLIAALGVTSQPNTDAEGRLLEVGDSRVLVAFGDSYMSGEGAEVFHADTDTTGNHCRRAPTAFAEMAGQLDPFNGFVSFACSGARTFNVDHDDTDADTYPQEQYDGIRTQLDAYDDLQGRKPFTPGLVVIGLGGNDAGFSTIGAMCLAPGDCADPDGGPGLLTANLAVVEQNLRATFADLADEFDGVPVAVVGYPDPVYSPAEGELPAADCDQVPLSGPDRDFVEAFLSGPADAETPEDPEYGDAAPAVPPAAAEPAASGLNGVVRRSAEAAGFYYVAEMERSLADAHLQLCDPRNDDRPGLNIIGLQSVPGEANERFNPAHWYHNSLHPNASGHAAMLFAFERWLAGEQAAQGRAVGASPDDGGPVIDPTPPARPAAGSYDLDAAVTEARTEADCQLYDPEKVRDPGDDRYAALPTCDDAGYHWAGEQVSRSLLVPGLWALTYLPVAAGAWLLAVTFFAWRRRVRAGVPAADSPGDPPPGDVDDEVREHQGA